MTGDRRRHAEPRVRVDMWGAEPTLRELVGDVVVFGQQLPGEIEGHRIRPMLADHAAEPLGHVAGGLAPGRLLPPDHRMQEPSLERKRLAEGRSLDAQLAEIGGMRRVPGDGGSARTIRRRQHAAAHAAVGACGAAGAAPLGVHQ